MALEFPKGYVVSKPDRWSMVTDSWAITVFQVPCRANHYRWVVVARIHKIIKVVTCEYRYSAEVSRSGEIVRLPLTSNLQELVVQVCAHHRLTGEAFSEDQE